MLKNGIFLFSIFILFGCTYEGNNLKNYFSDPRTLIKDPHFADYKEKRDALESQYLSKEIEYADYVAKMNKLDETYAKEVKERNLN